MKKFFIIPALIFSAGVAAWFIFKEPVFKATNGYLVNLDNKGVIIDGYDPISYFTGNGPVKGKPESSCMLFSSKQAHSVRFPFT